MIFARNGNRKMYLVQTKIKLELDNHEIKQEYNSKFLVITFDPSLSFVNHFNIIKQKCYKTMNLLKVLSHIKTIKQDHLITIYKSFIRSKIEYSFIPYLITNEKIKNDLQIIQNTALRTIFKRTRYYSNQKLHDNANIPSLNQHLSNIAKSYMEKVINNKQLLELFYNNIPNNSNQTNKYKTPFEILYEI